MIIHLRIRVIYLIGLVLALVLLTGFLAIVGWHMPPSPHVFSQATRQTASPQAGEPFDPQGHYYYWSYIWGYTGPGDGSEP